MSAKLRTRTPSPKTVTFDPSPPTTLERKPKPMKFRNLTEWEQYLSEYLFKLSKNLMTIAWIAIYLLVTCRKARLLLT